MATVEDMRKFVVHCAVRTNRQIRTSNLKVSMSVLCRVEEQNRIDHAQTPTLLGKM
jgi:hypothetical protein